MPYQFVQADFRGGMNLFDAEDSIGPDEYVLAFNIRNRTTEITPIRGPVQDTGAPLGKKQGIYAFDRYIVVFNSGAAYYKDIILNGAWTQVTGFAMNSVVDFIWGEAIPASSMNYERQLISADQVQGTNLQQTINKTSLAINGTPGGLVCQDGFSQPFIILPTGTARQIQTYANWTKDNREYVPVMCQMKYFDGILFGVDALDKTKILRSVSGRPLDFVVNVTQSGDKGGPASSVNYSVGFSEITCLSSLKTGELFAATAKSCHPIELNYNNTIFAEPTMLNRQTFLAGVVNNNSFIDILTDYTFIDFDGLRSYNAIIAEGNEGRNSDFSLKITRALAGIKQSAVTTAAILFDNYSFYSLSTNYGTVIAVYDNKRARWVCFDQFDNVGPIKQFALANQSENPTLYCITENEVFTLYVGDFVESTVFLKAISSGDTSMTTKMRECWVVLDQGTVDGVINVTLQEDNAAGKLSSQNLNGDGGVDDVKFDFMYFSKQCWKCQPKITWNNDGRIMVVQCTLDGVTTSTALKQQAKLYSNG